MTTSTRREQQVTDARPADGAARRRSAAVLGVPSLLVLLVNLAAVFGVVFVGWDGLVLLVVYWIETGLVVLFTFLKVVFALPGYRPVPGRKVTYSRTGPHSSRSFTVEEMGRVAVLASFLGLWGFFMGLYGAFIVVWFAKGLAAVAALPWDELGWLVALMAGEHAYSSWVEFRRGPEWARSDPMFHFWRPMGRMAFLYLVIFPGAWLTGMLGLSNPVLVLFIALKIVSELLAIVSDSEGPWERRPSVC